MHKIPELLAPAGGFEQLFYALHFGADAVYLATDRYGLRARSQNFSLADLPRAVRLVHDAGKQVYVTMNAYLHDEDLMDLPHYLTSLNECGVDAIIVSDLGMVSYAKRYAPNIALHVSTQASVSNTAAAEMWASLGAKRIVVAREMSLDEIARLKSALPDLEIEVFVQGAMCMALSGRCLISDYLTGRRANQGNCVQPCRWSYALLEESRPGQYFPIEEDEAGTYILNSKDLNMLDHLDELRRAGVDAIKIEGRVKKAFYVATVVNAYRHVLDGEDPTIWMPELETISHRPYSTGFYFGDAQQSYESDIYVQNYDWVAEVIACVRSDKSGASQSKDCPNSGEAFDSYQIEVRCRNRFYVGDTLEVLSPHCPIVSLEVQNLSEKAQDGTLLVCECASKAMGSYVFESPVVLRPHDILRVRRRDSSRKN